MVSTCKRSTAALVAAASALILLMVLFYMPAVSEERFTLFAGNLQSNLPSFASDLISSSPYSSKLTCCPPPVVYVRTHKTGSTTVAHVFLQFAYFHKHVNVALPAKSNVWYEYPRTFKKEFVVDKPVGVHNFDLMPFHQRFSFSEVTKVMPSNTKYVTIIRDPATMFESMYEYFGERHRLGGKPYEVFVQNISEHLSEQEAAAVLPPMQNLLTFDLGADMARLRSDRPNYMRRFIEETDAIFHLVMITEHFDESLVLLKHLMSWNTSDIVALKLNSRSSSVTSHNITQSAREKARAWNWADMSLHEHFTKKLSEKVREFGEERMAIELLELRSARRAVYEKCVSTGGTRNMNGVELEDAFRLKPGAEKLQLCRILKMRCKDIAGKIRERADLPPILHDSADVPIGGWD